jgi:hypothetical protein
VQRILAEYIANLEQKIEALRNELDEPGKSLSAMNEK